MGTLVQGYWRKGSAAALVVAALGLALTCGLTSSRWIGTPFPGFFVMANKVVASVSLPRWPVAHHSHIYQHMVVAVEGQRIESSEQLYALVRRLPAGSALSYTLEKAGQTSQLTLASVTFTRQDYFLVFVAYLFNGLAIALIGIGVWFLKPATPASRAMFNVGLATGLFALTGADLYSPHWFFRLHVLGEAFFPAGLLHLALVFPVDRFRRYRSLFLSVPYIGAFLLGAAYEVFLYQPNAYSFIHNLCMVYAGIGGLALLSTVTWDYYTTHSHLVRQRVRVIFLGFLSGYAFPAILMLSSGVSGGGVAVNYAAFTGLFFPLSLGYAIVKHDLFEIDALLKRGVYYLTLTAALTLTCVTFLSLLNLTLHSSELSHSPLFPLLFTLGVVLLLNPLKEHLQRGVDRVFFRLRYDPKKVLEQTSASLASSLQLEEILTLIWHTLSDTLGVKQGSIFLLAADRRQYVPVYPRAANGPLLSVHHPLIEGVRGQKGRVVSVYDLSNGAFSTEEQEGSRRGLEELGAQLLVPLSFKGELIGVMVLGHKESGAFFSADDIDFLYTLANQSALSIANALAYQQIQQLNAGLEQKVEERTQALAQANTELQLSVVQLEQAYRELQHSQENLVRAEKMAALGRLAAGIAHEMNTPLGASLTSLKLIRELVVEYQGSIGDPTVNEGDHSEIASEMDKLVRSTQQWMEKAAGYIRSLKLHTRNLQRGEERVFSVLKTLEEVGLLLTHRLRLLQCTLRVECTSSEPLLQGDPGKLEQVLTNLVVNATDAYREAGKKGGEIGIEVEEVGEVVEIRVRDQGCGIGVENLERVFEEFFSTKPLGEGTGLGLSIARDIVTNFFGGSISVESALGQGSTFILRLPRGRRREEERPIFEEWASAVSD